MIDEFETWQSAVALTYGLVVVVIYLRHFLYSSEMRKSPLLARDSPQFLADETRLAPLVSIMVPAKDEEATIERCLQSLRQQDYPNFEILVVDDRSDDATVEIVERIADEDPRVRLIRITELPDGWTGKTHALHVCRQHAKSDWYLFVDADTAQHPSCLSIVMQDALSHDVEVFSLAPSLEARSFWEGVTQPFAGTLFCLLQPLSRANDPSDADGGFANGQFILMQKSAYERMGGHESVRTEFCEDVALGRSARQHGLHLRVVRAPEISTVRMYGSVRQIVKGWSRIFYSTSNAKSRAIWSLIVATAIFSVLSYVNLLLYGGLWLMGLRQPFVVVMFWMSVVHELGQFTLYLRIYHTTRTRPSWYQVFRVCGVGVMLYTLFKTVRMCRTHRIDWRGTTYDRLSRP